MENGLVTNAVEVLYFCKSCNYERREFFETNSNLIEGESYVSPSMRCSCNRMLVAKVIRVRK